MVFVKFWELKVKGVDIYILPLTFWTPQSAAITDPPTCMSQPAALGGI